VCSIFGALSFNPPRPLLDQIAARLRPGGRLAIAARTPPELPTIHVDREAWSAYSKSLPAWRDLLAERDLHATTTDSLDHPTDPNAAGCVIIVACRPAAKPKPPAPTRH
jgi:hypothetical protein